MPMNEIIGDVVAATLVDFAKGSGLDVETLAVRSVSSYIYSYYGRDLNLLKSIIPDLVVGVFDIGLLADKIVMQSAYEYAMGMVMGKRTRFINLLVDNGIAFSGEQAAMVMLLQGGVAL